MKKYFLLISLLTFVFFLPFFTNPNSLITKNNDLARDYVPMFSFIHNSFFDYGQIPLWRSEQLMGETFVGNPLSALFYPGNILFILFPTNLSILLYIYIDFTAAAVFTFLLARSFKFSQTSSFAAAIFYAFSTKMLVHLEAGHITMLTAFALFPLAFLSVRKLKERFSFSNFSIGAVSLTCIYFTYPTVFYYSAIFLGIYWLYKTLRDGKVVVGPFVLLFLITIGLSSILLIPQLELGPLSTRGSMTLEDVAIPLWNFKKFTTSIIFPYFNLNNVNHEEFLYLGMVPTILAAIGFVRLKVKQKIALLVIGAGTLVFVAGLSTPVFKLAYEYMPALKYSRVTTRLWFAVALVVSLLAAFSLEHLKNKTLKIILLVIFLAETTFIFYTRYSNLEPWTNKNEELYQKLAEDHELFRVYCTTACLNSQLNSKYKIQILEGENPIGQKDFINFLAQAGNYKWDKFAVIFPPYEVWQTQNPPVPNAELLGQANVKYVASTYPLQSDDFTNENKYGDIYLYKNEKFRPRAYFLDSSETVEFKSYSPNKISLHFAASGQPRTLIFSENYYPGWIANVDHIKLNVEPYGVFRKIVVPANYEDLDIKFQPKTYAIGKTVSLATISFLVIYYFKCRKLQF